MQEPKKTSGVRNRSNQLELDTQMSNEWTEGTSSEETLQQNKMYAIKIFSCNIVCGSVSKQKCDIHELEY